MYRFFLILIACFILSSCTAQESGKMIFLKGGKFTMGSPNRETDRDLDELQRRIKISPFYIGKCEVTQYEFTELMGINPAEFKGDMLPIENISWFYAIEYCNRLSMKEGLTPVYGYDGKNVTFNRNANGYRLPTEAEWEYACRAGKKSVYNTGKKITEKQANFNNVYGSISPIGSYPPNSWGIYDMHGNVFEWCWDWYALYSRSDINEPAGSLDGSSRVIRGGSWANSENALRSACRNFYTPNIGNDRIGFRLARNAK